MTGCLRARSYAALASVFDEPTEELVRQDTQNPLLVSLAAMAASTEFPDLERAFATLWDHLGDLEELGSAHALRELEVEHTRLFVGPPVARVQPYERAQLERGAAFGMNLCEVYRAAGFAVDPAFKDLGDHIAVELEFMSVLLDAGYAFEAATFLQDHLYPFSRQFTRAVIEASRLPYYALAARALDAFLDHEHRMPLTRNTLA